jgi:hypothetical protein
MSTTIQPEEERWLAQLRKQYPAWTIRATARGYVAWKQSIYAPTLAELAARLDERVRAATTTEGQRP